MKLLRIRHQGRSTVCAEALDGSLRDLSSELDDRDRSWLDPENLKRTSQFLNVHWERLPVLPFSQDIVEIPFPPHQLITIGINFHCHAKQVGIPPPAEPILATKSLGSAAPPYGTLKLPKGSTRVDWEVELAVVIGRSIPQGTQHISWTDHVAGYCVANDFSDRTWLLDRGGQWIKGKSSDGFGRLGPYLVTPESLPALASMRLSCKINGRLMQDALASEMIYKPEELVAYISTFMSLHPGDTILCGSPAGVALGTPNPMYLQPGDIVESHITGLGTQRQICA